MISQRDWWDYVNYWQGYEQEAERGVIQRIYPDPETMQYLEERAIAFYTAALEIFHNRKHKRK